MEVPLSYFKTELSSLPFFLEFFYYLPMYPFKETIDRNAAFPFPLPPLKIYVVLMIRESLSISP